MSISKKQIIVLVLGGLALLAVIGLMAIAQDAIPVQAAGQDAAAEPESSGSLSGGNECYCAYDQATTESTPPPDAEP